jgi:hypothetical protein
MAGKTAARLESGGSAETRGLLARYGCGPGVFAPLRHALLEGGDPYMHLADLVAYLDADRKLVGLYADSQGWARKAIRNVAGSGRFSSDRTIAEYASEIWGMKPCPTGWAAHRPDVNGALEADW